MKKTILLFILGLGMSLWGWGQTTISMQDFDGTNTMTYSASGGTTYDDNSSSSDKPTSLPFYVSSNTAYGLSNSTATLTFSNQTGLGTYTSKYFQFRLASWSIGSLANGAENTDIVTVAVSLDNGSSWSNEVRVLGNTNARWHYSSGTANATVTYDGDNNPTNYSPSSGGDQTTEGYSTVKVNLADDATQARIRITLLNNSTNERWTIDDVKLVGTAPANDITSKVEAPTTQIAAGNIASTATASGSAVEVFKFKITDMGTADGLATKVTQVKVKKSSGTADWTDQIAGASLWDGVNQITTGTVVITDADITFPVTSGNLDVANNSSKEITMKIWLKTSNIVDNATMVFTVSQTTHGFTADASGSGFAADFGAAVTGNTMTVTVAATELRFTTAPSATACPNTNLSTPPVVKATDANGATDADFAGQVTLTNSGSIGMSNYQMDAVSGIANFATLQFTATGNVTLSAGASGLTGAGPTASIAIGVDNASSTGATNGNTQSVLTWTNPTCLDEIMIVAKAGIAVTATPSGDGSAYTANLAFGSGTGFDGGFVVYKGSASPQTVTGLTNGTTYHFTFFTRKESLWSTGTTTTATPAAVSSASDYFRSKTTGNWNSTSTWESSADGINWINATLTPTSSAQTIAILDGHTVTITETVTYDQVMVESGGQITVNSSITHTLANGTGADLVIQGTWLNQGGNWTINTGATWEVANGGTYIHNTTSGISTPIAAATLSSASNFIYRGSSSVTPAISMSGRTFGNLIFESTSGTWTASISGGGTLTVNGNFEIGSGVTYSTTQTGIMTFYGNFTNNGTLTNSTGTQNYSFFGSDKTIGGSGTITFETLNIDASADISLDRSINIATGFTGTISGNLDCKLYSVGGSGALTLPSGGTLKTANASGLDGSITVSGTKTLNAGANYVFNASSAQVTGAMLPTTVNNLTIDNAAGVTLSNTAVNVTGTLTINSGKIFEIGPGKQVTAATITNNGGNAGLVIKSDASGTGSLINDNAGVPATVERYIAAANWGVASSGWHMLSSPVETQAISGNWTPTGGSDYDFYAWSESATSLNWLNQKESGNNITSFVPGKGFMVAYESASTPVFQNDLNAEAEVITGLTRTTGNAYAGFNLVGNPYPCAIEWGSVVKSDYVTNFAQVWNSSSGSYTVLNGIGHIPAMNGFFVNVSSGSVGSITIPTGAKVHSTVAWYKSSSPGQILLMARDLDHGTAQPSVICFNENGKIGFDPAEDCPFMAGFAPQFYTSGGNQWLAVNTLPSVTNETTVPLWFTKNSSTNFKISLEESVEAQVFLTDKKMNQTVNLSQHGEYQFASQPGDDPQRFTLHFASVGVGENPVAPQIAIFSHNNKVMIRSIDNQPLDGEVKVYNMLGQVVNENIINNLSTFEMTLDAPSGYYIVRAVTQGQVVTRKIFIQSVGF